MTSFHLEPAAQADISTLAEIAGLAFENDAHTHLKAQNPVNPYDHVSSMQGALKDWLNRPPERAELTQAVDSSTGQILGWVCWGARNLSDSTAPTNPAHENSTRSTKDTNRSGGLSQEPTDPLAPLASLTSTSLTNWMANVMPSDARCMYIQSLVVRPSCQGRGVGTALIRHGTARADREGVYCWVSSSDGGWKAFAKSGFKEVERLELELAEHAEQVTRVTGKEVTPLEGSEGWGRYVFRYMKREMDGK